LHVKRLADHLGRAPVPLSNRTRWPGTPQHTAHTPRTVLLERAAPGACDRAAHRNPYRKARKQLASGPTRLAGTHPLAIAALPVVVGTVSTYRQSDAGYGGLSTFSFVIRLTVVECAVELGESLSCSSRQVSAGYFTKSLVSRIYG